MIDNQACAPVSRIPLLCFGHLVVGTESTLEKDRDWQLTYTNLVTQAARHHQTAGLITDMTLKARTPTCSNMPSGVAR